MIAHAEREVAALLQEVRPLDRRVGPFEQGRRLGVMRLRRSLRLPASHEQPAKLAKDSRRGGAVAAAR